MSVYINRPSHYLKLSNPTSYLRTTYISTVETKTLSPTSVVHYPVYQHTISMLPVLLSFQQRHIHHVIDCPTSSFSNPSRRRHSCVAVHEDTISKPSLSRCKRANLIFKQNSQTFPSEEFDHFKSLPRSRLSDTNLDGRKIPNVVIARDMNLASSAFQTQALDVSECLVLLCVFVY